MLANHAVTSAKIADGTIGRDDVNIGSLGSAFWILGGNSGTDVNSAYVGTTDNVPFTVIVNAQRALRLEPTVGAPNFVGGHPANIVSNGVTGGFIGGGGEDIRPNIVGANYATVPGGSGNTASGHSSIAGGNLSQASGAHAVALGSSVKATGLASTALGSATTASGAAATALGNNTVAGGFFSLTAGDSSTANGNFATALGRRAKANHDGTFTWADAQNADFTSTAPNQFNIRASGGVGIGTGNPQAPLHLYSANNPATLRLQSAGGFGAARLEFVSDPQGSGNEWRPGYIQSTDNGGFIGGLSFVVNGSGGGNLFTEIETMRIVNGRVGIGTATPVSALQVVGTVTATAFNPPSDRNLKENFSPVSPREVLEKVATLPISRWNFKGDAATPHVGPMAQDFYAAFGTGTDERHIATVDADGVALAAIQGLNQKLEQTLEQKETELTQLKRTVAELKELVTAMNHKLNGGGK
jgi:hypothetical protein